MRKFVLLAALAVCAGANAQYVKVTPLGTHAGELCNRDRATIFEDPSGLRILYDAGASVTGADDPRLGTIHVVLVSHAHGDHMGDMKLKAPGAGAKYRLGNESDTYGEIGLTHNWLRLDNPPLSPYVRTTVMLS